MTVGLLATVHKDKLPTGFSYPVGAETLSAQLVGAPQFSVLALRFKWRDEFWASRYKKKLEENGEIVLLETHYTPTYDEWVIRINAVPREQSQLVRTVMSDLVVPKLRDALHALGSTSDYFSWRATYNLVKRQITKIG